MSKKPPLKFEEHDERYIQAYVLMSGKVAIAIQSDNPPEEGNLPQIRDHIIMTLDQVEQWAEQLAALAHRVKKDQTIPRGASIH